MSIDTQNLPDDPTVLKAMIAALQAENAKISATLRVHDQLVQALRLRIAKWQKLALEDLLVAVAEGDDGLIDEGHVEPSPDTADAPALRRRPRVSDATTRERRELDPGSCCPDCGGDLRVVGEDVSELLDMIAAQMKVIQIARIKKSCRRCEKMVQEPAPSRPIPGSMAGPNLLAHILVTSARAQSLEDVAFLSGAALATLHLVVERADVPHDLLRDRLSLTASEACVRLLRPRDQPGPAGAIYLLWQRSVARPISVGALQGVVTLTGLRLLIH